MFINIEQNSPGIQAVNTKFSNTKFNKLKTASPLFLS